MSFPCCGTGTFSLSLSLLSLSLSLSLSRGLSKLSTNFIPIIIVLLSVFLDIGSTADDHYVVLFFLYSTL